MTLSANTVAGIHQPMSAKAAAMEIASNILWNGTMSAEYLYSVLPKGAALYFTDNKYTHVWVDLNQSKGRNGAALRYHLALILKDKVIRVKGE